MKGLVRISQVDLQLESGEYFLSNEAKAAKKRAAKDAQQAERSAASKRKKEEAFVPPKVRPGLWSMINKPREGRHGWWQAMAS